MTPKLHDVASNSSDQDVCSQSPTSSQHRRKGSTNSSEESCSSSDTDDTPKQHDRSGQRRPTPAACPYISTMLGRRHLLQPPVSSKMTVSSSSSSSTKIIRVRRGSLFEKLVANGVSEELACRRQHMYDRLVAVVSSTESDDGD